MTEIQIFFTLQMHAILAAGVSGEFVFNCIHVIARDIKNEPTNNEFGKSLAYFKKSKELTLRLLAKIF